MSGRRRGILSATVVIVLAGLAPVAVGQAAPSTAEVAAQPMPSLQPLVEFRNADIKFNLLTLMDVLRDRNHEDWVLAAYPDPNTELPLIGAGFSLNVPASEHTQWDPLNPNQFLEPASSQLWLTADLDPAKLRQILEEFNRNMDTWGTKGYRRRIRSHTLRPQLTEEEATQLLRISAIQAVVNARAYCRNFDQLSGPAQMALSELVFQMGINLEEFVEFLSELNGDTSHSDLSQPDGGSITDAEHWKNVQDALIDSQWARRYTVRAISVIAMFDPQYASSPHAAESRVMAILPPPVQHRHGHSGARRSQSAKSHGNARPHSNK
jgi:hypothetical protein